MTNFDTIVIGGGIVGMTVARGLARRGQQVALFDRNSLGLEASKAAGGMLMPQLRPDSPLGKPFLALALDSLRRYKRFIAEIEEECGAKVPVGAGGSLLVAFDKTLAAELQQWGKEFPVENKWRSSKELLRLEPALSPDVIGGCELRSFVSVHSQDIVALMAWEIATPASRVAVHEYAHVRKIEETPRAAKVITDTGSYTAAHIVIAAGAWSSHIEGVGRLMPPVKPIRGQIIKVLASSRSLLRHTVYANKFYLVPRGREILIGSTLEDVGFEKRVTVSASADLLAKAQRVMPAIGACGILDSWAGLRPMVADGYPVIGKLSDRVIAATGHFRDGILLAPATAAYVTELVCEGKTNSMIRPFGAERFAAAPRPKRASAKK